MKELEDKYTLSFGKLMDKIFLYFFKDFVVYNVSKEQNDQIFE